MQQQLLNARSVVTRTNIESLRRLILENIDLIKYQLNPLEQQLLIDDLFLPLDLADLLKILKLLLKFKEKYFVEILMEFYSLKWICVQNVSERDWEEWINLIFSINSRFSLDLSRVFTDFLMVLKYSRSAIGSATGSSSGIEFEKFLEKVTRTGNLQLFFKSLASSGSEEVCIHIIASLVLKCTMYEQELFLVHYLDFLVLNGSSLLQNCHRFTNMTRIKDKQENSLKMVLENRFFQKFQDYQRMHLLIHSISVNQEYLVQFTKSLIRNWGNSNLILSNSVKSCVNYTNFLLLALEHLGESFLANLKLQVINGNFL